MIAVSLLVSCQSFAKEDVKLPYKDFKPFKMVFLPDTHLSFKDNDDGPILYKESLVILQDVIRSLNQTQNPDFVVFGGNLTNNDDAELADMPMFLDTIADLNAKYYAILGDKEAAVKEEFIKDFDEFGSQTFWTAEPEENVLLVGLDTSIKGEEDGYVNIHQLFWLDNVLKNNRDKFTIITMHHSPHLSLEKSDLFLELINLYPQVKVVLSGHNRINLVKKDNGKLFINCPSIVSYPNEYKILNIYPDRVEVDNKKISFKQIIKKAKKLIGKDYKKPDKFSKKSKYYF
ncbi:MAG: hypothetical protein A2Y25_04480 [Candidatus Melainabacteria bacterium GWF2_37_15]|nr:MAG: hypothetical protein A2Y25_04480 [Candidatus Melainabacteria bacterium GWF2_37_15]